MMATTQDDIRRWLKDAKKEGATHLLVVCDTFDHGDYPVSVKPGEDPRKVAGKYARGENMQRLMEVYALHLDWEAQLAEHRSFHYENAPPAAEAAQKPRRRRATKPKGPNALTAAQRGILREAAALPSCRLVLRGVGPIRAGRRLVALGYMRERHLPLHARPLFEITKDGRKAAR
jgi:hypothetical protein